MIYLTSGSSSTYVGWTENTNYTINLNNYPGSYDGVIIKSAYSIFRRNASDGIKILFSSSPNTPVTNNYVISMLGLSTSLKVNDTYNVLGTSAIESITLNGTNIKSSVTNLKVGVTAITKNGASTSISTSDITKEAGTYRVTYTITFTYNGVNTTKTKVQTVLVQ